MRRLCSAFGEVGLANGFRASTNTLPDAVSKPPSRREEFARSAPGDGASVGVVREEYYGEDVAARYDESSSAEFDPDVLRLTVDVLEDLAQGGAALEFAIGTGRVALPLAARGISVSGIELSPAMVERLRAKDGAEHISVMIGDM